MGREKKRVKQLTIRHVQFIILRVKTLMETVAPEIATERRGWWKPAAQDGMVGSRCRIPEVKITPEFRTKTPAETVQEVGFDGYLR